MLGELSETRLSRRELGFDSPAPGQGLAEGDRQQHGDRAECEPSRRDGGAAVHVEREDDPAGRCGGAQQSREPDEHAPGSPARERRGNRSADHDDADGEGDLDRIQQGMTSRLAELAQLQHDAVAQAHTRVEADMEELKTASEEQRAILAKLREEFERVAQEAGAAARREVEIHESERRRALHEVSERLRQRERELRDRIAAEETDAVGRIKSGFADVERRQIEQLTRIVDRTANRLSEAAVEQFSAAVKAARDDAAKRLSRELDRAVAQFAHDAQSVLAERLAQVSDAGASRVDRKLNEIVRRIETRRDEFLGDFQRRFSDVEVELRSQIRALAADAEAERAVLEARVLELTRRLETAVTTAESSLEGAFRAE